MKFRRGHREAQPAPDEDIEHFTMPADNIYPPVTREKDTHLMRIVLIVFSAAVVLFGTAVVIVAVVLGDTIHTNQSKGALRDQQHTQTENQIKTLTNQLRATQIRDNQAVCTLIIGLIEQGKQQNPGRPIDISVIGPFLSKYECKVPPGLLTP